MFFAETSKFLVVEADVIGFEGKFLTKGQKIATKKWRTR